MSRTHHHINISLESFICIHCGAAVGPTESGGYNRNHCPHCLHSLHLDIRPGDRRSACRGEMAPISVWVQDNGEWSLVHRCTRCGFMRSTRIAADDNELSLFALAALPMTSLPFPGRKTLAALTTGGRQ